MNAPFFVRGLTVGFAIAATVGPICLLCIQRTLARGRAVGLVSGLGAATADALYGAVAGFGLTSISSLLVAEQSWMRLGGGVFLCWLGVRTALAIPAVRSETACGRGLAGAYGSTFLLTLTNPLTVLSFTAIFAGLGLAGPAGDRSAAMSLVLGVFTGSAVWWLLLSSGVNLVRGVLTARMLRWVNMGAGALIALIGLLALLSR